MIGVSQTTLGRVIDGFGVFVHGLSKLPAAKLAADVLDEEKVHDQVALICKAFGIGRDDLRGKRLLEIGSGFGIFVAVTRRDYGMDSCGLEPDASGFENSYAISRSIMSEYGLKPEVIVAAHGESIPFPNSHFDFVFSSTVLEHTDSPELVLNEAVRVLKPGGCLQVIFPNYGSVFEGHYAIPWIPYLPRWLARIWVRFWGRDPSFVDTLQFTNYFRTRRWLRQRDDVEVLTLGEEIFSERVRTLRVKDWGGLGRMRRWLTLVHRLHLIEAVIWLCLRLRAFDPIILTLRRKANPQPLARADNQGIYDLNWSEWVDMKRYGPSSRWLRALVNDLIKGHLVSERIRSVLDFGCGEGSTTFDVAKMLPMTHVLGIDQSEVGISCARANYRADNLSFRCEAGDVSLGSALHDLVTCFEVLEHVAAWQELTVRLAAATTRYVLVSFPTGRMRSFEVNVGHLRNFKRGEFETVMAGLGFRPVQVCYAGFPFFSPIFRNLCELTNSGGNSLTRGKYSFLTRRLADLIYFAFRHLSTKHRYGDQFCGLFERISCSPTNA